MYYPQKDVGEVIVAAHQSEKGYKDISQQIKDHHTTERNIVSKPRGFKAVPRCGHPSKSSSWPEHLDHLPRATSYVYVQYYQKRLHEYGFQETVTGGKKSLPHKISHTNVCKTASEQATKGLDTTISFGLLRPRWGVWFLVKHGSVYDDQTQRISKNSSYHLSSMQFYSCRAWERVVLRVTCQMK